MTPSDDLTDEFTEEEMLTAAILLGFEYAPLPFPWADGWGECKLPGRNYFTTGTRNMLARRYLREMGVLKKP
jgi:hypothetical protein